MRRPPEIGENVKAGPSRRKIPIFRRYPADIPTYKKNKKAKYISRTERETHFAFFRSACLIFLIFQSDTCHRSDYVTFPVF